MLDIKASKWFDTTADVFNNAVAGHRYYTAVIEPHAILEYIFLARHDMKDQCVN